jgi:hypothetical protein
MRIGGLVALLAIEESRLVALEGDVKGVDVRDIIGIEVAKVGIKLSAWDLGARLLKAGFGEGVVQGTEVEVDALALTDSVDVWWVEHQLLVGTDEDGDDGSGGTVDLACFDIGEGAGGFFCDGGGRGECEDAEEGGDGCEGLHDDSWRRDEMGIVFECENENVERRNCFVRLCWKEMILCWKEIIICFDVEWNKRKADRRGDLIYTTQLTVAIPNFSR